MKPKPDEHRPPMQIEKTCLIYSRNFYRLQFFRTSPPSDVSRFARLGRRSSSGGKKNRPTGPYYTKRPKGGPGTQDACVAAVGEMQVPALSTTKGYGRTDGQVGRLRENRERTLKRPLNETIVNRLVREPAKHGQLPPTSRTGYELSLSGWHRARREGTDGDPDGGAAENGGARGKINGTFKMAAKVNFFIPHFVTFASINQVFTASIVTDTQNGH